MDRCRVGERMRAALAGLQELRLLKERQRDMVSWALRMDREEPVTSVHTEADGAETEEQRLEASLSALKQQLSRLRKQDVGLKTHLQQLDQQISELKLDVGKVSSEQLESDSRPSSGFYELSDGGSCSRSNSCTSVYSECLSSSQTSLVPIGTVNRHKSLPPQVGVARRRSADENPPQLNPMRPTGLHLGSSRIRASAAEQIRPRPVSTGDLEKMVAQGGGHLKALDVKKSFLCPKISKEDSKFQQHLESCSGMEVYRYPSPLHAVALQSPFFSLRGAADPPGLMEDQQILVNDCDTLQIGYEFKTLGYIDMLLQRNLSKIQSETGSETLKPCGSCSRKPAEHVRGLTEATDKEVSMRPSARTRNFSDQKGQFLTSSGQEHPETRTQKPAGRTTDSPHQFSFPASMEEYSPNQVASSFMQNTERHHEDKVKIVKNQSVENGGDHPESRPQEKKPLRQRPATAHSSGTEESPCTEAQSAHTGSPEFVHAKFLPAGAQRVKIRQADRKTKAVKLKRRSSEEHRAVRQQSGCSSGERSRETNSRGKGDLRRAGKPKEPPRVNHYPAEELRQGSGSDSSLYSPGLATTHKTSSRPLPSSKPSKSRRLHCHEYAQPVEQRKRRQMDAKWSSNMEVFQAPHAPRLKSKEPHAPALWSMQMVRSMSARQSQWMRPRPIQSSTSSSSFLQSLNAKYPPAPFQASSLYPPRCESEYSAECASLFHSTIAESSEGETSDNTTNRFGDSESSQSFQSLSDSDSSLSLDEEDLCEEDAGLVWAEAALGPTTTGCPVTQIPPRPEPSACRIKASRALKKKIRRFQPASLKVMTLV
uniref:Dishevelled binding antagonist of beta catenin 2 n=1 Tax=Oryzias latipes TaxID=8090 RepID=A0A3P9LUB7_ORYLA